MIYTLLLTYVNTYIAFVTPFMDVRPVSNVVLLPYRAQFINYEYVRIHLKVC